MATTPRPDRLLLQLLRLSIAQFDMRCADTLVDELEQFGDSIDARAYALFTGMAVSYARPFEPGRGNAYGPLEGKWSSFPDRPDLRHRHLLLIGHRNSLLAHNDLSPHRVTLVWPKWQDSRPAVLQARAPINAKGVSDARELFRFQEERFGLAVQELADRLQRELGWPAGAEVDLDEELRRLRAERAC